MISKQDFYCYYNETIPDATGFQKNQRASNFVVKLKVSVKLQKNLKSSVCTVFQRRKVQLKMVT